MCQNGSNMTGEEYHAALRELGLSLTAAAKFLGIGDRTSMRYKAEGPTREVELLLRLMLSTGTSPDDVIKLANRRIPRKRRSR
jgi:hypothetical protein